MGRGARRKASKVTPCDILVQGFPAEATSPADIPPDFVAPTLGSRTALIEKIVEAVPEFDFSDPAWGVLEAPDCQMEVHLGYGATLSSLSFHVHGGELAGGVVQRILARLALRGLDLATGKFFDGTSEDHTIAGRYESFQLNALLRLALRRTAKAIAQACTEVTCFASFASATVNVS